MAYGISYSQSIGNTVNNLLSSCPLDLEFYQIHAQEISQIFGHYHPHHLRRRYQSLLDKLKFR